MVRLNVIGFSLILLMCGLMLPAAWAQQASGIAGVVRDTSGGVLPGVTVEASSPALIEKVRTAFTDGEGRYNVVDLRPGTYTVTFSLAGFTTVRREGIELTSGFTAAVNADLQVGALEETVTVTGASPVVDVQNVRRQQVVTNELLETLPTSTKHLNTLVMLTPANLDAYNALNAGSILSVINTYGPRWLQPASILDPRIIEVGGQISF